LSPTYLDDTRVLIHPSGCPKVKTGSGRGAPTGVTSLDGSEAGESPTAFVATTVKVYPVPLVNPVTVQDRPAVEQVFPPGVLVTV
jgi:hypothetical protein